MTVWHESDGKAPDQQGPLRHHLFVLSPREARDLIEERRLSFDCLAASSVGSFNKFGVCGPSYHFGSMVPLIYGTPR